MHSSQLSVKQSVIWSIDWSTINRQEVSSSNQSINQPRKHASRSKPRLATTEHQCVFATIVNKADRHIGYRLVRKKSPPLLPLLFKVELGLVGWRCEKKAPDSFWSDRCPIVNFESGGKGAFFSHRPVSRKLVSIRFVVGQA